MAWGAVIGGGAALLGGIISSKGSKSAANTSAAAADQAVAEQRRQFDVTQQNQQPWLQAGQNALAKLQNPDAFTASPSYQFRRSEGDRGVERTAAARGGAFSGNALKALNQYNSNLASQEYGNWFGQQAQIAGLGQGSANTLAAAGSASAGNIGNALMAGGDARASGILGASNGIVNNLNNGINTGLLYNGGYFNKPQPYGGFGPGGYQGNSYADIYG